MLLFFQCQLAVVWDIGCDTVDMFAEGLLNGDYNGSGVVGGRTEGTRKSR